MIFLVVIVWISCWYLSLVFFLGFDNCSGFCVGEVDVDLDVVDEV